MKGALTLDHAGALVRDLAAGAARWERLGFTLSPQSRQRGAVPGAAGMQPWASANRCAIFRRGYLELIGLVDPGAHNPWARFLSRFEGLHLLALRCENADAAYADLSAQADFLQPPVQRERPVQIDGAQHTMRFRNIFSDDARCPEGRYIVIEHQTPDLLWQPSLMAHPNGACSLREVLVVAQDDGVAGRLRALGSLAQSLTAEEFARRFAVQAHAPSFAAVTVSFADVDAAARMMETRGVALRRSRDDLWVPPEESNGFVLRMVQD